MKKFFALMVPFLGLLGSAPMAHAQPTEYLKVCSLYGAGFYYIPGTDICLQPTTGDAREETTYGVWRSMLPYPEGDWVAGPNTECGGTVVKVGSFKSTDFSVEIHQKKATAPFSLPLTTNQFISNVMMGGGFYDPRIPAETAVNGAGTPPTDGLCLRAADPDVEIPVGEDNTTNPGIANLAIGCISNSRIVNVPQVYSIAATQAYPQILVGALGVNLYSAPIAFGDQVVVSTDLGTTGLGALTYCDPTAGSCTAGTVDPVTLEVITPNGPGLKPLAGTLNVWACVEGGS